MAASAQAACHSFKLSTLATTVLLCTSALSLVVQAQSPKPNPPAAIQGAATNAAGFAKQVTVAGVPLPFNGSGIRYKVFFKVYNLAMYTASKVSTAQEVLSLRSPIRLHFVALRELPGADLGVLFLQAMKDNSPQDLINKHEASINRLVEIFSGRAKIMPNETFAMDFVPGKGTTFYIQDVAQGAPIGNDEFSAMVLKIWLGQAPVDNSLKDALLGLPS
jgi:Chalcone isomerase-like